VPESVSASIFTALTPKWDLMGDITWTGWSQVQQLDVIRATARLAPGGAAGSTLTSLPFKWNDTFRLAVGANYQWSNQSKLRFGLAYDKTPSKDTTRTPRLPDQDRVWLAAGVQYRVSKSGVLDFGYAHEFIRDATVNVVVPGAGTLSGKFANQADIISIQYSHSF
jgi:long-chain fatty acid transport protein